MVSGNLAVVANGRPDPRCPLDSNARINDHGIVTLIRSVEGRRSSVQFWSGGGYRQIRVEILVLPGKPEIRNDGDITQLKFVISLSSDVGSQRILRIAVDVQRNE